jgi:hypothetical protein
MCRALFKQRVVIEREMPRPEPKVMVGDLFGDVGGVALLESVEKTRPGAERAAERTAARRENGKPSLIVQQADIRPWHLGKGTDVGLAHGAVAENFIQDRKERLFGGSGDDDVGTRSPAGMLCAQCRVNPAEDDGDGPESFPNELDGQLDAGIPIGHRSRDQDDVGNGQTGQLVTKNRNGNSVARIFSGNAAQDSRLIDLGLEKRPPAVGLGRSRFSEARTGAVQAIQEMEPGVGVPANEPGRVKQPERAQPEIIGREIVNPGVDEEDIGFVPHFRTIFEKVQAQLIFIKGSKSMTQ